MLGPRKEQWTLGVVWELESSWWWGSNVEASAVSEESATMLSFSCLFLFIEFLLSLGILVAAFGV